MSTSLPWPAHAAGELILGDPASCVGVCCLWTDRRRLAAELDPSTYAALGNLYSSAGIGPLVRNVLANPGLRYLVVCGADVTSTGTHLVHLFQDGLDASGRIAGTEIPFDPQVPAAAIEELRRRVALVDLRGVTDAGKVRAALAALPPLPALGEPMEFPRQTPYLDTLPAEGAGFVVRQASIARAWLESIRLARTFGRQVTGEGGAAWRELSDILVVVTEPADRVHIPSWMPLARAQVASRVEQLRGMLGAPSPDGRGTWTWRSPSPADDEAPSGPIHVRGYRPAQGRLSLSVLCGDYALDAVWAKELYALRLLQLRLAEGGDAGCGPLLVHVLTLRLGTATEAELEALVERHYPRQLPWRSDPRGVFYIRLEDGEIVLEHGLVDLGKSGRVFRGIAAAALYKAAVHAHLVLYAEHAAYLGAELQKAELALRLGLPYRQDDPLDVP